jgi:hypothetical protein
MYELYKLQPVELASDAERDEMERKQRETSAFFREMEQNIHNTFENHSQKDDYDDSIFLELKGDEMYEFGEDNYHDDMDNMLCNSVNSFRDGKSMSMFVHCVCIYLCSVYIYV